MAPYPPRQIYPGADRSMWQGQPIHSPQQGARPTAWRAGCDGKDMDMPVNGGLCTHPQPHRRHTWIKPEKAWDWWNDGTWKVSFKAGINMDTYKYYIDSAMQRHQFIVLDGAGTTQKAVICWPSFPNWTSGAGQHGKEKGVELILWQYSTYSTANWNCLQEVIFRHGHQRFCKSTSLTATTDSRWNGIPRLPATAKHKLLTLDLHGIYKPTGINRTYPNITNPQVWLMEEVNGRH